MMRGSHANREDKTRARPPQVMVLNLARRRRTGASTGNVVDLEAIEECDVVQALGREILG